MQHKESNIYKLSGYFYKTWETRWLVLKKDKLKYYLSKEEARQAPEAPRQIYSIYFQSERKSKI